MAGFAMKSKKSIFRISVWTQWFVCLSSSGNFPLTSSHPDAKSDFLDASSWHLKPQEHVEQYLCKKQHHLLKFPKWDTPLKTNECPLKKWSHFSSGNTSEPTNHRFSGEFNLCHNWKEISISIGRPHHWGKPPTSPSWRRQPIFIHSAGSRSAWKGSRNDARNLGRRFQTIVYMDASKNGGFSPQIIH